MGAAPIVAVVHGPVRTQGAVLVYRIISWQSHLVGVGAAAVVVVAVHRPVHAQGQEQPVGGEGGDDPARDGGARRGDRPVVEVVRRQLRGRRQRLSVENCLTNRLNGAAVVLFAKP